MLEPTTARDPSVFAGIVAHDGFDHRGMVRRIIGSYLIRRIAHMIAALAVHTVPRRVCRGGSRSEEAEPSCQLGEC